jgi:hypothetical protein
MATWTDKSKSTSNFINKSIRGLWKWSDPSVLWSDPNFTWGGVKMVTWTDRLRNILTYLLTEDGGYLLQEDGGRIVLTGDVWINRTKH